MTLNKTQLVNLLAAQLGSTKTDCDKFLTGLTVVVTAALKGGNDVTLPGLVKISLKEMPATEEKLKKNPFTGQMVTAKAKPASKKVRAKALGYLKKAVI